MNLLLQSLLMASVCIEVYCQIVSICVNPTFETVTDTTPSCSVGRVAMTKNEQATAYLSGITFAMGSSIPVAGTVFDAVGSIYDTHNEIQMLEDIQNSMDSLQQCIDVAIDNVEISDSLAEFEGIMNLFGLFDGTTEQSIFDLRVFSTFDTLTQELPSLFAVPETSYRVYEEKLAIWYTLYPLYTSVAIERLIYLRNNSFTADFWNELDAIEDTYSALRDWIRNARSTIYGHYKGEIEDYGGICSTARDDLIANELSEWRSNFDDEFIEPFENLWVDIEKSSSMSHLIVAGDGINFPLPDECTYDLSITGVEYFSTYGNDIAVRCCSEDGSTGESDVPDCYQAKTWREARRICESHGMELCSADTIHLTDNTGCYHDARHVWVSDECTLATRHWTVIGDSEQHPNDGPVCTDNTQNTTEAGNIGVRCCFEATGSSGSLGLQGRTFVDLGGSPGTGGECYEAKTWIEAAAICSHGGARLCTAAEMYLARGTGSSECLFDDLMIWTSDACATSSVTFENNGQIKIQTSETGDDRFGYSVAIGNGYLAFSAYRTGEVFVYAEDNSGAWNPFQTIQLPAQDQTDYYVYSLAIFDSYMVIGARYASDSISGAVYVFKKDSNEYTQIQRIEADDIETNDYFGSSVAISEDYTIIIGSIYASTGGAVYVYSINDGIWEQTQKLEPSDASGGDWFGQSLSISGNFMSIGASGGAAAYVFERDTNTNEWSEAQILKEGSWNHRFGGSVSISNDYLAVGDTYIDSVYIYERDTNTNVWNEVQILEASLIGSSVSMSGNTLIVGAPSDSEDGTNAGAVYIFERLTDVNEWQQIQKMVPSDIGDIGIGSDFEGDNFGYTVAISNENELVIGAIQSGTDKSGAVYVF